MTLKTKTVQDDQVDNATKAHVQKWTERIEDAKEHFKKDYKRMKEDMKFSIDNARVDEDDYVANFILRHVQNRTAQLYAKNPTVKVERRPKLLFTIWDGDERTISEAQQAIQMIQMGIMQGQINPQDPHVQMGLQQANAVLKDFQQGKAHMDMVDKVGRTLSSLMEYFFAETEPRFKTRAKQMVRRTVATGIGWVKVGFQREMGLGPDIEARIADDSRKLAHIQRLIDDKKESGKPGSDGDDVNDDQLAAELKASLAELQASPETVLREGMTYSFPKGMNVILDPSTTEIKGFVGTKWVAEEYRYKPDEIKEIFGVDIGDRYTAYGKKDEQGTPNYVKKDEDDKKNSMAIVWEVWDRTTGTSFAICDGYDGYLREPERPVVAIDQFFPYIPVTFNDVEDEEGGRIYPPSDVRLMMDMQKEYNRARHGLREHRIANRPGLVSSRGALDDSDKEILRGRPANALVELNGLAPGQKVGDMIQGIPKEGIDPNLYETSYVFDDTQRVVGVAEANFGGTSNSTATESSIAESSRMVGMSSNADDMDDFLSELCRMSGQILLENMSAEQVIEIVGIGAQWPELTRGQIAKELFLTIEAGSAGRPNKALELNNWQQMLPFFLQMPGIPPKFLMKESFKRLDDRLNVEDVFIEGLPSMQAMNAMMGPQGGMGGASPAPAGPSPQAQGAGGAQNAQRPSRQAGGSPNLGAPAAAQQPYQAVAG